MSPQTFISELESLSRCAVLVSQEGDGGWSEGTKIQQGILSCQPRDHFSLPGMEQLPPDLFPRQTASQCSLPFWECTPMADTLEEGIPYVCSWPSPLGFEDIHSSPACPESRGHP